MSLIAALAYRAADCGVSTSSKRQGDYGTELLKRLAADLTTRFGRGFGPVNLSQMKKFYLLWPTEKIFQTLPEKSDACLCWVSNKQMNNATLRKRFGISEKDYAIASRIIGEAIDANLIKPYDPESTSRKYARYIPFWA